MQRLERLKKLEDSGKKGVQQTDHWYFIEKLTTTLLQYRDEYKGDRRPAYMDKMITAKNKNSLKMFEKESRKEIKKTLERKATLDQA